MNIQNALKLYRFLKKLPPSRFNFDFVALSVDPKTMTCKSAGCMAGFIPTVDKNYALYKSPGDTTFDLIKRCDLKQIQKDLKQTGYHDDYDSDADVAAEFLGVDREEANELFYHWDDDSNKRTKLGCLFEFDKLVIQKTGKSIDRHDEDDLKKRARAKAKPAKKAKSMQRRTRDGRFAKVKRS